MPARSSPSRTSKGLLIGIEGIDAAGKRTQTTLLKKWLKARGFRVAVMSFPDYQTRIGGEIRAYLRGRRDYPPEVAHMLFAANRWEKKRRIERLLAGNDFVLVNRYTESNLAFGTALGLDPDWLAGLERGLPKTALVIVLDALPSSLSRRRANKDAYERSARIQRGAREAYLRLASRMGWKVVDASTGIRATGESVTRAVNHLMGDRTP